ncbi:hypothetical protein DFJ77DRAFT_455411 [Powellomyces hirtus]|nr:hypothetical protein DFJ77DRAFT_455411 [Powellomyces hirtus]
MAYSGNNTPSEAYPYSSTQYPSDSMYAAARPPTPTTVAANRPHSPANVANVPPTFQADTAASRVSAYHNRSLVKSRSSASMNPNHNQINTARQLYGAESTSFDQIPIGASLERGYPWRKRHFHYNEDNTFQYDDDPNMRMTMAESMEIMYPNMDIDAMDFETLNRVVPDRPVLVAPPPTPVEWAPVMLPQPLYDHHPAVPAPHEVIAMANAKSVKGGFASRVKRALGGGKKYKDDKRLSTKASVSTLVSGAAKLATKPSPNRMTLVPTPNAVSSPVVVPFATSSSSPPTRTQSPAIPPKALGPLYIANDTSDISDPPTASTEPSTTSSLMVNTPTSLPQVDSDTPASIPPPTSAPTPTTADTVRDAPVAESDRPPLPPPKSSEMLLPLSFEDDASALRRDSFWTVKRPSKSEPPQLLFKDDAVISSSSLASELGLAAAEMARKSVASSSTSSSSRSSRRRQSRLSKSNSGDTLTDRSVSDWKNATARAQQKLWKGHDANAVLTGSPSEKEKSLLDARKRSASPLAMSSNSYASTDSGEQPRRMAGEKSLLDARKRSASPLAMSPTSTSTSGKRVTESKPPRQTSSKKHVSTSAGMAIANLPPKAPRESTAAADRNSTRRSKASSKRISSTLSMPGQSLSPIEPTATRVKFPKRWESLLDDLPIVRPPASLAKDHRQSLPVLQQHRVVEQTTMQQQQQRHDTKTPMETPEAAREAKGKEPAVDRTGTIGPLNLGDTQSPKYGTWAPKGQLRVVNKVAEDEEDNFKKARATIPILPPQADEPVEVERAIIPVAMADVSMSELLETSVSVVKAEEAISPSALAGVSMSEPLHTDVPVEAEHAIIPDATAGVSMSKPLSTDVPVIDAERTMVPAALTDKPLPKPLQSDVLVNAAEQAMVPPALAGVAPQILKVVLETSPVSFPITEPLASIGAAQTRDAVAADDVTPLLSSPMLSEPTVDQDPDASMVTVVALRDYWPDRRESLPDAGDHPQSVQETMMPPQPYREKPLLLRPCLSPDEPLEQVMPASADTVEKVQAASLVEDKSIGQEQPGQKGMELVDDGVADAATTPVNPIAANEPDNGSADVAAPSVVVAPPASDAEPVTEPAATTPSDNKKQPAGESTSVQTSHPEQEKPKPAPRSEMARLQSRVRRVMLKHSAAPATAAPNNTNTHSTTDERSRTTSAESQDTVVATPASGVDASIPDGRSRTTTAESQDTVIAAPSGGVGASITDERLRTISAESQNTVRRLAYFPLTDADIQKLQMVLSPLSFRGSTGDLRMMFEDPSGLDSFTCADLKAIIKFLNTEKSAQISLSGSKAELVQRVRHVLFPRAPDVEHSPLVTTIMNIGDEGTRTLTTEYQDKTAIAANPNASSLATIPKKERNPPLLSIDTTRLHYTPARPNFDAVVSGESTVAASVVSRHAWTGKDKATNRSGIVPPPPSASTSVDNSGGVNMDIPARKASLTPPSRPWHLPPLKTEVAFGNFFDGDTLLAEGEEEKEDGEALESVPSRSDYFDDVVVPGDKTRGDVGDDGASLADDVSMSGSTLSRGGHNDSHEGVAVKEDPEEDGRHTGTSSYIDEMYRRFEENGELTPDSSSLLYEYYNGPSRDGSPSWSSSVPASFADDDRAHTRLGSMAPGDKSKVALQTQNAGAGNDCQQSRVVDVAESDWAAVQADLLERISRTLSGVDNVNQQQNSPQTITFAHHNALHSSAPFPPRSLSLGAAAAAAALPTPPLASPDPLIAPPPTPLSPTPRSADNPTTVFYQSPGDHMQRNESLSNAALPGPVAEPSDQPPLQHQQVGPRALVESPQDTASPPRFQSVPILPMPTLVPSYTASDSMTSLDNPHPTLPPYHYQPSLLHNYHTQQPQLQQLQPEKKYSGGTTVSSIGGNDSLLDMYADISDVSDHHGLAFGTTATPPPPPLPTTGRTTPAGPTSLTSTPSRAEQAAPPPPPSTPAQDQDQWPSRGASVMAVRNALPWASLPRHTNPSESQQQQDELSPVTPYSPPTPYLPADDNDFEHGNSNFIDRPGSPYSFVSGASVRLTPNHPRTRHGNQGGAVRTTGVGVPPAIVAPSPVSRGYSYSRGRGVPGMYQQQQQYQHQSQHQYNQQGQTLQQPYQHGQMNEMQHSQQQQMQSPRPVSQQQSRPQHPQQQQQQQIHGAVPVPHAAPAAGPVQPHNANSTVVPAPTPVPPVVGPLPQAQAQAAHAQFPPFAQQHQHQKPHRQVVQHQQPHQRSRRPSFKTSFQITPLGFAHPAPSAAALTTVSYNNNNINTPTITTPSTSTVPSITPAATASTGNIPTPAPSPLPQQPNPPITATSSLSSSSNNNNNNSNHHHRNSDSFFTPPAPPQPHRSVRHATSLSDFARPMPFTQHHHQMQHQMRPAGAQRQPHPLQQQQQPHQQQQAHPQQHQQQQHNHNPRQHYELLQQQQAEKQQGEKEKSWGKRVSKMMGLK